MNIWQYVYENDPKENDNLKKENDPKYKYGPSFDKPKNMDNLKKKNDLWKKATSNIRANSNWRQWDHVERRQPKKLKHP